MIWFEFLDTLSEPVTRPVMLSWLQVMAVQSRPQRLRVGFYISGACWRSTDGWSPCRDTGVSPSRRTMWIRKIKTDAHWTSWLQVNKWFSVNSLAWTIASTITAYVSQSVTFSILPVFSVAFYYFYSYLAFLSLFISKKRSYSAVIQLFLT